MEIILQCVLVYCLELINCKEDLYEVLDSCVECYVNNCNFEFYYFFGFIKVWIKIVNLVMVKVDKVSVWNYFLEYVVENYVFKVFCELVYWVLVFNLVVVKILVVFIFIICKVFYLYKVYVIQCLVCFNEMEYNVLVEVYQEVFSEMIKIIECQCFCVYFLIENWVVVQDDVYFSLVYGCDFVYIVCYVYNKKDYCFFFKVMEDILKVYDGCFYWGKMYILKVVDLVECYLKFQVFQEQCSVQDF